VASNTLSLTVAPVTNPAPTVTRRTPAVNARSVGLAANITATFSEPVVGVTGTTFQIKNPAGTVVAAPAPTRSATNANQWILNPTSNLVADTKYTVTLTGGTGAIRDSGGAALANVSWTFTTGPAPTLSARTPGIGATGVRRGANITATFSEALAPTSVNYAAGGTVQLRNTATNALITATATFNATTRVLTINPSVNLASSTQYTVRLANGLTDLAGNPFAGVTWNFTTGTLV